MKDKKKEIYIIAVSTYKFYSKFRPSIKIIIDNIQQKLLEIEKDIYVVILGSNSKAEIIYNEHLYIKLKSLTNKVDNTSGLLNLNQAIDIITQSDYYIGANNGLSNIAQIAGSYGMQLFSGPEKPLVRKFSNKMDFQYIKPNT